MTDKRPPIHAAGIQPFSVSGEITQQRAEAATDWLIHNAKAIAFAKAEKDMKENMLRVVKSLEMKASDEKSAAAQEREAYASERYRGALQELFEATVAYETAASYRNAAEKTIDVWRSINSTLRGARV